MSNHMAIGKTEIRSESMKHFTFGKREMREYIPKAMELR